MDTRRVIRGAGVLLMWLSCGGCPAAREGQRADSLTDGCAAARGEPRADRLTDEDRAAALKTAMQSTESMLRRSPLSKDDVAALVQRWFASPNIRRTYWDRTFKHPKGEYVEMWTPHIRCCVQDGRRTRMIRLEEASLNELRSLIARQLKAGEKVAIEEEGEALRRCTEFARDALPSIRYFAFEKATLLTAVGVWSARAPQLTREGGFPVWWKYRTIRVDSVSGCVIGFGDGSTNESPPDFEAPKIDEEEVAQIARKAFVEEIRPAAKYALLEEVIAVRTKLRCTDFLLRFDETARPMWVKEYGWHLVWIARVSCRWRRNAQADDDRTGGVNLMVDAGTGRLLSWSW